MRQSKRKHRDRPGRRPLPTTVGEIWRDSDGRSFVRVLSHAQGFVEVVACDDTGDASGNFARHISRHMFGIPGGYTLEGTWTPPAQQVAS